jgi:hypothetical protein
MNDIEKLKTDLKELINILKTYKLNNWVEWFSEALNLSEKSPKACAEKIKSAYGGMGSFNDIGVLYHIESDPDLQKRFDELHDEVNDQSIKILSST